MKKLATMWKALGTEEKDAIVKEVNALKEKYKEEYAIFAKTKLRKWKRNHPDSSSSEEESSSEEDESSDEEMKMSFAERKQKEKEDLIATYKSYVNKKARVYFEGKWYTTTILSFDVDKMRHQIKYDKEQSTEIINMKELEKEGHIRWMKPKVIKKKMQPRLLPR